MFFDNTHIPVMADEVIDFLDLKAGYNIVDCTIGAAGHSRRIIEKIMPGGKLIGIDQDSRILEKAKSRLEDFKGSFILKQENFRNLDLVLKDLKIDKVDGLLFDLGVSSLQLESVDRGFSFNADGPLDMRMGNSGKTAADLVNTLSREELADIIFRFGEERYSRRIAEAIARARRTEPIKTTGELKAIVLRAMPKSKNWQKIHPATRTFQALRIAVNSELDALEEGLVKGIDVLREGGKVCVISFHSLEDRIVKNIFKEFAKQAVLRIVTKKPITPKEEELKINPRSRSAKLRVALKV